MYFCILQAMEKAFSKARGSRSDYEAMHRHKILAEQRNEVTMSAFSCGFFKGFNLPLSLSIPEIKRKKRELRRIKIRKSHLGNQTSDWANIKGDMRRAMKYAIRTDR